MVWHLEEPIGREDIAYLFVAAREASRYVDLIVTGFGFDGLFAGLPEAPTGGPGREVPRCSGVRSRSSSTIPIGAWSPGPWPGRALKKAYFRGREFPAPQLLGTPPLAPFPGFPRGGDQPLTNFLRRGFLTLPYQHAVERLYAGVGMRMNAQHTNPDFLAAAFSIPDGLKIHGRTQKYILRRACEGLLSPSILATGKSFNRLKHDTRMSELLDSLADDLLSGPVLSLTRTVRSALRGQIFGVGLRASRTARSGRTDSGPCSSRRSGPVTSSTGAGRRRRTRCRRCAGSPGRRGGLKPEGPRGDCRDGPCGGVSRKWVTPARPAPDRWLPRSADSPARGTIGRCAADLRPGRCAARSPAPAWLW